MMGRYSDSDDSSRKIKKKKKKRSRSRSRSAGSSGSRYSHSHRHKKSKRKHRQRSRSRSCSRSPDRHSRRDRPSSSRRRKSRSHSRDRRSRSGSRDRRSSRKRSPSRERSRRSPSDSGSRKSSAERKRGRRSLSPPHFVSASESNTLDDIPGFKDMTPAEQAQLRLKMALKMAMLSDDKLKEATSSSSPLLAAQSSPLSRQQFAEAVASIETDSFAPSVFKSSRSSKGSKESREGSELPSHHMAMFGAVGNSVVFTKTEPMDKHSTALEDNPDNLFDSALNVDPEEKMKHWIHKLTTMRRKKLEGEIITSF